MTTENPALILRDCLNERKVDAIELAVKKMPQAEMPLVHRFTPHLYTREITMPRNALVISRIHKFEHPFIISKGSVSVWTEKEGVKTFTAPYCGITTPGTRRILFIHEDCIWTTFHVTNETDVDKIVSEVTESHESFADDLEVNEIFKMLTQTKEIGK